MYAVTALVLLAIALGGVMTVIDSVLETVGLGVVRKIPVVGPNLELGVAILLVWLLDVSLTESYTGPMRDTWIQIVIDGVVVFGMVPVKDAIVSAIDKGLRA